MLEYINSTRPNETHLVREVDDEECADESKSNRNSAVNDEDCRYVSSETRSSVIYKCAYSISIPVGHFDP